MTLPVNPEILPNSDPDTPTVSTHAANIDKRAAYLVQLLQVSQSVRFSPSLNQAIAALQQQAAARLPELTLPSIRDEEWRFTDLAPLLEMEFHSPDPCFPLLTSIELKPFLLPEVHNRLVFVNGTYEPEFSHCPDLPEGVTIGHFKTINDDQLLHYFAQQPGSEEVFTTLNTAAFQDIAILWLHPNVVVETPVHLIFVSTTGNDPIFYQPRTLVIAERNSRLHFIEDYITSGTGGIHGLADRTYFSNSVTEICLDNNAQVSHYRIQREGRGAFHIGKTAVTQKRDSHYSCLAVNLGARLSRHNLEVFHQGEQVETQLQSLALASQSQLSDTHSAIFYNHPYCASDQLHKAIVDDQARSVFNGKIVVPQAAQLTNAGQLNRNLLLSPKARVDTKPQLEIVADNVKCSHGATVSQLQEDEVFYLQSRGLDRKSAQNLLIDGFAAEILTQLPILSLRKTLAQAIHDRTCNSR